ncbi:MAG: prepilin-type N-terminal cleavage/methylation domain-containing protein [Dissulfurispiraceae bacterium]
MLQRHRNDFYTSDRSSAKAGFTLLEVVIVICLILLILGLSTLFFANTFPSSRLEATARQLCATIREARALAQIRGERQIISIDLDSKQYGIEGRGQKTISPDISIKVVDPLLGELYKGQCQIIANADGIAEGGTVVLSNSRKTFQIQMDPVIGAVIIK